MRKSTGLLKQLLEGLAVSAVPGDVLEVRIAADMLLADVDVGDGALTRNVVEGGLELCAVRLLVQLVSLVFGLEAFQGALGGFAVGAVGFAEDNCCGRFSIW